MPVDCRFSQLSPSRQAFVRLCQSTNYGHILDLTVRNQDPILTLPTVVRLDVKLDGAEDARRELSRTDFVLCAEFCRLISILDNLVNGRIASIEIRAGVPRRIVLEKLASELGGCGDST